MPPEEKASEKSTGNESAELRNIILDTNILSRLGPSGIGQLITDFLQGLLVATPGWGLAISDVSVFEILNEIPADKEGEASKLLAGFAHYAVDQNILLAAAQLGCVYKRHFIELKIQEKMPEPGDKIIASTSFVGNALVCTANTRDFPSPFFKEIARQILQYESGGVITFMPIYFLEPQRELISAYHNNRHSKTFQKKTSKKK